MFESEKLLSLYRENFEEIRIYGEIVVHDGERVVFQTGEHLGQYPMRSLLKPFQLLATGLSLESRELEKWAPCVGSISATEYQVSELKKWYTDNPSKKFLSKLKLTLQLPADEENRARVKRQNESLSPFFHMCFSKHMAILMACEKEGWNLENYHEKEHPFQKKFIKTISDILDEPKRDFKTVVDGCKLPSPVLTLSEMAHLYQKLGSAPTGTTLAKIRQIMTSYPEWVGGPERVDTLLMKRNTGLVAKEGADGLLGIALPASPKYPKGVGVVVKVFSGFHMKLAALAVSPLLQAMGLNTVDEYSSDHRLEYHYKAFQKRVSKVTDISPSLSEKIAVWPGDEPFQRKIVMDTLKGNHLTLSNISTTLHVGAHTDAVNHTEATKNGIDTHSIETYCGRCQVIEIRKGPGTLIDKNDFEGKKILAKRVLIKTLSFPNPHSFNEDFMSFSKCAIDFLASQGVVLVGIDTPSIDPFSSKELPAHHAVFQHGLAILEGIVLVDVEEGFYHLSSVPLKIAGGDASPVRAFLTSI